VSSEAGSAPPGVLVLGMHRSGTSAATRLISLLGPDLCPADDLVVTSDANPTGHWESQTLVDFNDRLLREMGRMWWCPPPAPGPAYDDAIARIVTPPEAGREVFERVHPRRPWVWKDPRTVATMPYWRNVLSGRPAVVAMVRNPLDAAESLQRRNRFGVPLGVAMWERYNRLLLTALAGLPVFSSAYDELVDDPIAWSKQVREFLAQVGVTVRADVDHGAVEAFVRPELRHNRHSAEEVERSFPSAARLHVALSSVLGVSEEFVPPAVDDEPAWVEAELAAIGAVQKTPVPRPARPIVSVVVDGGATFGSAGETERGPVLAWRPRLPADYFEVSVVHGTTQPRGSARNRAVAAARGDIVVFIGSGVRVSDTWWPDMRRALAAGHSAVAPAVRTSDDTLGCGMTWRDRWLNRQWCPAPSVADAVPAFMLPDACFAVTREALDAVGGFDPALGAHGLDTAELCLRLWRAGRTCAVAATAVAEPGEPDQSGPQPDWEVFLHDLIRLASVHFDAEDVAYVIEGLRATPGFTVAAARVQAGDVGIRRRAVHAQSLFATSEILERFRVRLDPTKTARRQLRSLSGQVPSLSSHPPPPQGDHRMVFIGGLHGSGLGLVTRILRSHPLVSAFNNTGVPADEGQHLQDVYAAAQAFGGPGRFAVNVDSHMDEQGVDAPAVVGRKLFGQWSPHWDLSRPVLAEKSPPNLVRTRFLEALFPGSRFVMVQRHPVAVALLTSDTPVVDMDAFLENWFAAWERFEADRPELDHAFVVGYETLVSDPAAVIGPLGQFLSLDGLDASALIDPGAAGEVAALWADAVTTGGPEWVAGLIERFGARAAAYGYDLTEPCAVGSAEAVPGPTG